MLVLLLQPPLTSTLWLVLKTTQPAEQMLCMFPKYNLVAHIHFFSRAKAPRD